MIKEVILFSGGICFAAIVMTPSDEANSKVELATSEEPFETEADSKKAFDADEEWGYEDDTEDESEAEDFVFGQPLVTAGEDDDHNDEEPVQYSEPTPPASNSRKAPVKSAGAFKSGGKEVLVRMNRHSPPPLI